MDRESLKKSGLLEQYVLGLTSRKESVIVERAMQEDPEVMQDYQKLRDEMSEFIETNEMMVPNDGRQPRTARDFEELDHEMVVAIIERSHSLIIWRYALGAICLLLICLSGYLFRLSENNRHATVTEKAMHAQDNNNHDMVVKDLQSKNDKWTELKTIKVSADSGTVLVHFLSAQQLLLLDFSHLAPLPKDFNYVAYLDGTGKEPFLVIPAGEEAHLRGVAIHKKDQVFTIYRRPVASVGSPSPTGSDHKVASFSLEGTIGFSE